MFRRLVWVSLSCALVAMVSTIHLQPIRVPSLVTEGSSVYLHCPFQLDGFLLESVNWRKNGRLFFAFLPAEQPQKRVYSMSGVRIDLSRSNASHVFLQRLNHDSQGRYSCELSSSQPFHKQVSSEDQLTVVHSDYLLTPLLNTGPRNQPKNRSLTSTRNSVFTSSSASAGASLSSQSSSRNSSTVRSSTLVFNRPLATAQTLSSAVETFSSTVTPQVRLEPEQISKELDRLRWSSDESVLKLLPFKSNLEFKGNSSPTGPEAAGRSPNSILSVRPPYQLQQEVKGPGGFGSTHAPSARLEIEDDDERPSRVRPAITSPMRPGWSRPATTAQVLPLRPQQFHDIRFLLRNDVLLFQPFQSNDGQGRPSVSTASMSSINTSLLLALWFACISRTNVLLF
jgi:hypothetical protein